MNVTLFDLVLTNLLSFCGGCFATFLFVFNCENKRFKNISNHQDASLNHQQTIYPNNSPVLSAVPSAPTITEITLK